jgi:hypothetical protein
MQGKGASNLQCTGDHILEVRKARFAAGEYRSDDPYKESAAVSV